MSWMRQAQTATRDELSWGECSFRRAPSTCPWKKPSPSIVIGGASHFVFAELKIRASTPVFVQPVILMVLFATY